MVEIDAPKGDRQLLQAIGVGGCPISLESEGVAPRFLDSPWGSKSPFKSNNSLWLNDSLIVCFLYSNPNDSLAI